MDSFISECWKYFDNFGVEHFPKEIKKFIGNKIIIINIYRTQAYNSTCGCFCIRFIDFMLKGKSLLDFANLVSPNDYEKNDKIILNISIFRWGTHLYISLFPSISPSSVTHHISGTVHHLIIIFGTHM